MKSDSVWYQIKLGVKSCIHRLQSGDQLLHKCSNCQGVNVIKEEATTELATSSTCLLHIDSVATKRYKFLNNWGVQTGHSWRWSRRRSAKFQNKKSIDITGKETEGCIIRKRSMPCPHVTFSCVRRETGYQLRKQPEHSAIPPLSSKHQPKNAFPQSLYCLTAYHFCWSEFAFLVEAGFELNLPQFLHCDGADSHELFFRFISVLDLFLYVVEKCHFLFHIGLPLEQSLDNTMFDIQRLHTGRSDDVAVFPRILSALLINGADVRLTSLTHQQNCTGGLPISRICSLSTIAARELACLNRMEKHEICHPIDAAGIIRQLIQAGLQPEDSTIDSITPSHTGQCNFYQALLYQLAIWSETRPASSPILGPRLQSYVILLLNILYSGLFLSFHGVSINQVHPEILEMDDHLCAIVSTYHSTFLRLTYTSPPRLFILARRSVRKLIGTRFFHESLNPDIHSREDNEETLHNPLIQVRQKLCSRLPEELRRSVAYLEASDVNQEIYSIANVCL